MPEIINNVSMDCVRLAGREVGNLIRARVILMVAFGCPEVILTL